MTVTLDNKPIVIPDAIRRKAGFRQGDRIEFKVSGRAITIVPQTEKSSSHETPDRRRGERRAIGRAIAQSEKEYRERRSAGPFGTHQEFLESLHAKPETSATKKSSSRR